jgi:ferredoxin
MRNDEKVGAGDTANSTAGGGDYEPVWIESPECTACDECTTLAPKAFVYNEQKLAVVTNPERLEVRRHRQGRREMHGRLHPSRHALEHERAGRGQADGAGGEVQLMMKSAFNTEDAETQRARRWTK